MKPTIAVVIPTRSRPQGLRRALRSVYRQSTLPAEVIVIDDCSETPVTEEIFAECPREIRCTLLRNSSARGAPASRNLGLRTSTADYVALLDDDDEFVPEKVRMLERFVVRGAHVVYHAALMMFDDQDFSYVSAPPEQVTFQDLLLRNVVGGTSMVCVQRQAFLDIGGFDEAMPALQDYEAWLRCAKRGLNFERANGALTVYHHVTSAASISKSLDKFDSAIARIEELYSAEYSQLSAEKLRLREERTAFTRAQRMVMNNQRWRAARYCLRTGIRAQSLKIVLGALPALVGLKAAMKIKNFVGL